MFRFLRICPCRLFCFSGKEDCGVYGSSTSRRRCGEEAGRLQPIMNIFEKIRDSYDRLYQGAKGIALFFLAAVIVIIAAEILKYTGTIPPAAGTVVQAVFVIAAAVIYIKIEREEEDD